MFSAFYEENVFYRHAYEHQCLHGLHILISCDRIERPTGHFFLAFA